MVVSLGNSSLIFPAQSASFNNQAATSLSTSCHSNPSSDTPYFVTVDLSLGSEEENNHTTNGDRSSICFKVPQFIVCKTPPVPGRDSLNGELIRWTKHLHVAQTTYFLDFWSQSQDLCIGQLREHVPNQNLPYLAKPVYLKWLLWQNLHQISARFQKLAGSWSVWW